MAFSGRWDAAPHLFQASNGVLNITTGQMLPPRPEWQTLLRSPFAYNPEARAPRFERFLVEIFDGQAELIAFVHRFLGYAATGFTREQCLLFAYGVGRNGKSVLLETMRAVLGSYAHVLPFESLQFRRGTSIPNDLAALEGRRFVTVSEVAEGVRLHEARVKSLTGGDRISARYLHREWFDFEPVAKFVLAANHKPAVSDDSEGFWRRVRLVPFLRRFEGANCDLRLRDRLLEEGEGVLAWLVAGAMAWAQQGLGTATACEEATADYRAESDRLRDFMDERLELDSNALTSGKDLRTAYAAWAESSGVTRADRLSAKSLGGLLSARFSKKHRNDGAWYAGVRIKA
jgi:putative DNA primase/helicase